MSYILPSGCGIKVVQPLQWRGMVVLSADGDVRIGLFPNEDAGDYTCSHSFNIEVLVKNSSNIDKWVPPLHIITLPRFKETVTGTKPGSDSFNSFSSKGFAVRTSGFEGINRGSDFQSADWNFNWTNFVFNRDNSVDGNGLIHWKFNDTALNLGSVVVVVD